MKYIKDDMPIYSLLSSFKPRSIYPLFLMLIWGSIDGYGQLINSFDIHYQIQQKGSIVFISNAAASCGALAGCGTSQNENPPAGTGRDNSYSMSYINIDAATAGIFMSSSDSLNLPNCSEISWAGLYWGAAIATTTVGYNARDSVKLKVNTGAYLNLKADTLWDSGASFTTYHCFKNITSIVKANGIKARYTLANMPFSQATGNFGGWTIVVVFKNDLMDMRNLTVFSGLANVSSTATSNLVDIPINGFLTPPTGPVTFELGMVVYDGDRASTGDSLLFKGGVAGAFVPVSDALHNSNDVFNSTISNNGVLTPFRNPSYRNTLGYDANIFRPVNTAKNFLNNSITSATIRQRTVPSTGETYLTQVVTSAIDVYEPDMKVVNKVTDINGGILSPGDTLEYTLTLKNIGSDIALSTVFEDTMGFNILYVPNSIRVTVGPNAAAVPKTDGTDTDQASYNAATRSIKVNIGTGANGTTGGQMVNSPTGVDSTIVKFRATVTTECTKLACDNTVSNRAFLKGIGQVSGNFLIGASNPDLLDAFGCPLKGSTVTALNAGVCPTISASSNSPICVGDTIKLYAPTSTGATYAWSGPAGFTSIVQNPIVLNCTAANDGVYTVTITYFGSPSCSSVYPVTVVVKPLPTPSVAKSNNLTCATPTATLTASPASGVTYAWGGGGTAATKIVNAAGTYTVTVTNTTTGCSAPASVVVTSTVTYPTAAIAETDASCTANDAIILRGSSANLTASGGTSYAWDNSLGSGAAKTVSPLITTIYTVTVTDAIGCTATASKTITVDESTITSIGSGNPTLASCPALNNGNISISATGSTLEYSINNGTTWQSSNIFNSLSAGSYTLKIRNTSSACVIPYTSNPVVLTAPTCVEICDDGIDNDGNGLIDCFDAACRPIVPALIKRQ
jgi:uncharacterized repeat protein (TIGR01451 family)